jgi:predicted nucleotidyltransferase
MRLSEFQRKTIQEVVHRRTAGRALALLFGSRLDDGQAGGDIDLFIRCPTPVDHPARLAAAIGADLELALGEQRIDVLIDAPNLRRLPPHERALDAGVPV